MAILNYINPPNYWLSDGVPTATDTPNSGDFTLYDIDTDQNTNNQYQLIDATPGALVWQPLGTQS